MGRVPGQGPWTGTHTASHRPRTEHEYGFSLPPLGRRTKLGCGDAQTWCHRLMWRQMATHDVKNDDVEKIRDIQVVAYQILKLLNLSLHHCGRGATAMFVGGWVT